MTALNPVEALQAAFPDAIHGSEEFRGQITIIVDRAKIVEVFSEMLGKDFVFG